MHTWQTELTKELKTVAQGLKEAGNAADSIEALIGQLETVACNEANIAAELNHLGLQWFARKIEALDFHQKAKAENEQQEAEN